MSNASASQSSFDFWEFVACGTCQLPFISTSGPTIPFWLTECGHIICNNHLRDANQSCIQCGAQQIQLRPLQLELEAPMSDWFRSIPEYLDAVAFTGKFQLQTMATQIRHYRSKSQRQRAFIERLERDMGELKQANEALKSEVAQLRQELDLRPGLISQRRYEDHQLIDIVNPNGKRSLNGYESYDKDQTRPKTTSSPRSIGADRLTLPQGRPVPNLLFRRESGLSSHDSSSQPHHGPGQLHRSGNDIREQYAYRPPSTSRIPNQRLTRTQATGPQTSQQPRHGQQASSRLQAHQEMHLPLKLKPGEMHGGLMSTVPVERQNRSMGPPPTPQVIRQQLHKNQVSHPHGSGSVSAYHSVKPSVASISTPQISRLEVPASDQTQFDSQTSSSRNAPRRFIPSGYRIPSRAEHSDVISGSNRTLFRSHQEQVPQA